MHDAVDHYDRLLAELHAATSDDPSTRPVLGDMTRGIPGLAEAGLYQVIACMGDTLAHAPDQGAVDRLLADAAGALAPGGRLVLAFRDLTEPRWGADRFLLVRSDAETILTCFLEYSSLDTVVVHDLLHQRDPASGLWQLRSSAYPKLRLAPDEVARRTRQLGLSTEPPRQCVGGMWLISGRRPA